MAEPSKIQLFSDDEGGESDGEVQLTINEHYAKAFEYRKEREELQRLKDKYGSDYDPDASDSEISTDSESAESEDEHGEELTPAVDAAILRTLARIKKKDPSIYDSQKNIFGEESEKLAAKAPTRVNGKEKSKDKAKPITIRQANLQAMLTGSRSPSPEPDADQPLTHTEEQEALRRETIAVFHGAVPDNDEGDDFLIPREKTQDEREKEEEEYRAFLEREVGDLKDLVSVDGHSDAEDGQAQEEQEEGEKEDEKEAGKKKKKKSKSKKDSEAHEGGSEKGKKTKAEMDHEFLLDYIMNRGWIDRSKGHVPTYNEVTSPADEKRKRKGKSKAEPQDENDASSSEEGENEEMDTGLLSDASFDSVASYFEASYNHRFEEPGADKISAFPRNLPSLVRRPDTTRKEARERRKKRKEEELKKKREEVQRMKALKMREVKRKLEIISRQGGLKTKKRGDDNTEENDEIVDEALRELDLDGEWDPEKHDRQMAGLFDRGADAFEDDAGYGGEEEDGVRFDEDGKPVWDDDIDIGDIPMSDDDAAPVDSKRSKKEKKKKKKKKGGDEDDGGVDIDAMDADVPLDDEEWDGTEEMRKRVLNKYMDEVYGLEFNDMVGDLPTRFKYVPVPAQDFALTPAEILMATDQELNEYMSVKKYAPYRQDKGNKHKYHKKTQDKLWELKAKIAERTRQAFGVDAAGGTGPNAIGVQDEEAPKKRRKGKKERMKLKAARAAAEGEEEGEGEDADVDIDMQEAPTAAAPVADNAKSKKSQKRKREHEPEQEKGRDNVEEGAKTANGVHVNGSDAGEGEGGAAKKKRKRRHKKKDEEGVVAAQV